MSPLMTTSAAHARDLSVGAPKSYILRGVADDENVLANSHYDWPIFGAQIRRITKLYFELHWHNLTRKSWNCGWLELLTTANLNLCSLFLVPSTKHNCTTKS